MNLIFLGFQVTLKTLATNAESKSDQDKIEKLQTYNSSQSYWSKLLC